MASKEFIEWNLEGLYKERDEIDKAIKQWEKQLEQKKLQGEE